MRAAVLALVVTLALPARADIDIAVARRAEKHQVYGSGFIIIGALNTTLSLGSFIALGLIPQFSDAARSGIPQMEAGAVGLASAAVALPALAAGITLRRIGDHDAFAASQSLGPDFFAERAHRRRRVGGPLTIAGVALTLVGVGFGGAAWATLNDRNHDLMPAMAAVSGISGAVGLALLSVGATLYAAGK